MAWSALFKAELVALSRSWVLRGWLIALALSEFFLLSTTLLQNRVHPVAASGIVAAHLDGFLLIWSALIIVLGAGAISTEQEVIADSILSRACTRTQYIAAKLAARALVVLGVFLLSSAMAGLCAWRSAANDMTLTTLSTGILITGLAVLLLLSLGITLSVIVNNTVFAIVGALLLWYVASPIFSFVGATYLSPTSLIQSLPRILKDPNAPQVVQATATATSLTVAFSKDLDPQSAEQPGNYVIEGKDGQVYAAQTAVYDQPKTSVVLGGLVLPAEEEMKITVRSVMDRGGSEISPAGDSVTATVPKLEKEDDKTTSRSDAAPKSTPAVSSTKDPGASKTAVAHTSAPAATTAKPATKPASTRKSKTGNGAPPRVLQCTGATSNVKIVFSADMDSKEVEKVDNYVIESPPGHTVAARTATYTPSSKTVILSGLHLSSSDPVKVTVRKVHDRDGVPISTRANSATYAEITTWKYVLGFGLPTLFALTLSTVWFTRRDL